MVYLSHFICQSVNVLLVVILKEPGVEKMVQSSRVHSMITFPMYVLVYIIVIALMLTLLLYEFRVLCTTFFQMEINRPESMSTVSSRVVR